MSHTLPPAVLQLAQALAGLVGTQGDPTFTVQPSRYVLIPLASARTGYSVKAIEKKIEDGVWAEGQEWTRAPDGRIVIDMEGYERWVAKAPGSRSAKRASGSSSRSTETA
jgi:hypothetical protein